MIAAERWGMRLGFLQDVVADWWEVAVDFQFEDVQFFEKNVNTRRKTDCCVMAHSKTIELIRNDLGLNPRNDKYNMHMTVAEKWHWIINLQLTRLCCFYVKAIFVWGWGWVEVDIEAEVELRLRSRLRSRLSWSWVEVELNWGWVEVEWRAQIGIHLILT